MIRTFLLKLVSDTQEADKFRGMFQLVARDDVFYFSSQQEFLARLKAVLAQEAANSSDQTGGGPAAPPNQGVDQSDLI